MNPHRLRAYIFLLIATTIWGIAGPVIKFTLGGFRPEVFLLYRFFISGIVGVILMLFMGIGLPKKPRVLLIFLIHAVLTSTIALGILFLGFDKTTAIDATLIGATAPIFISIAGAVVFKERVTKREIVGITIAFAGTALTIVEPLIKNGIGTGFSGNVLIFISTLISIITAVTAKILVKEGVKSGSIVNWAFVIGFLTTLPITLTFNSPNNLIENIINTPLAYHLGVIYMALLSGSLAYFLWTHATKSIEIGEVGLFAYLYPLFATPLAIIWLKETVSLPFIFGAAIIAVGVIIAEVKTAKAGNG